MIATLFWMRGRKLPLFLGNDQRRKKRSSFIQRLQTPSVIFCLLSAPIFCAQTPDPQAMNPGQSVVRPPLTPAPAEQNWSFLAVKSTQTDFFDSAKYLQLSRSPQHYLSTGLEYRTEYEYYNNWAFGSGVQDHSGYVFTRVMPHFDLHLGSALRLYSELKFDYIAGRNGRPRVGTDEDRGDVHQTFVEVGSHVSDPYGVSFRMGRQEIVLGSGRFFDNNEGPNVKLAFDGIRAIAQTSQLRLDFFAVKPVEADPGFFDDVPHHSQTAWGAYATVPMSYFSHSYFDLYYLGLASSSLAYARGTSEETRHTLGVRAFRSVPKGLGYNWEQDFQWGTFGTSSIRAWSVSTETGYMLRTGSCWLRPMLRADVWSGDGASQRRPLGTFNSFFPRGAYFTPKVSPSLAPQNLADLHPVVQATIGKKVTAAFSWNWYWRESTHDGVYAFGSGASITSGLDSHARYLGNQGDLELRWSPVEHTVAALNLEGFKTGGFLAHGPNHRNPIAVNTGWTFRF